jgi:hypothetical protein
VLAGGLIDIIDAIFAKSTTAKADTQPLRFVNVSRPARFGKRTKRHIRTHVSRDLQRRKREEENSVRNSSSAPCLKARRTNLKESALQAKPRLRQSFISLDTVATFSVKMEPYMYSLVHRCKCPQLGILFSASLFPAEAARHCRLTRVARYRYYHDFNCTETIKFASANSELV